MRCSGDVSIVTEAMANPFRVVVCVLLICR
jgi:hypothetical protein